MTTLRLSILIVLFVCSCIPETTTFVDDHYDPSDPPGLADLRAIERAITAAGDGGIVLFTSGTTYEIPSHIVPKTQQTIASTSSGLATLRRANAVRTTLTAAACGVDYLDVEDATVFEAGWDVSPLVSGGTGGRADGEPLLTKAYAIVGNRLMLNRMLTGCYQVGDRVVGTPRLMLLSADGTTVNHLRIDGNRAGNTDWISWATHMDIHVWGLGVSITNIEMIESTGTPIYVQGTDLFIGASTIADSNLSALHLSNAHDLLLSFVTITDVNSQGALGEHSVSAIEWSLGNTNITIVDSVIEGTFGYAFGGLIPYSAFPNYGITIERNTLQNNTGTLLGFAPPGTVGRSLDLRFAENVVIDSGEITLTYLDPSDPLLDVVIDSNDFWNSTVTITYIDDSAIIDNTWHGPGVLNDYLLVTAPGPNVIISGNSVVP